MFSQKRIAICFSLFLLVMSQVPLVSAAPSKPKPPKSNTLEDSLPDELVKTHHAVEIDGKKLSYTAEAGSLPIRRDSSKTPGKIFFVAYTANGEGKEKRPLAFVFNGGPGAASAYLHLGALGPKRLVFNDDGTPPPPPARLSENHHSWLAFTDLVFIDPIGTGFSRLANAQTADKEKRKKGDKESESDFWGTREDLKSLAEFIRLYLTRNERWQSPKFLVGESYGGFRVAALSSLLVTDYGIGLSGLVMLSPVLEFSLIQADDYRALPWALLLPSYTAAAMSHGKSSISASTEAEMAAALSKVESFSLNAYLVGLAGGYGSASESASVFQKLSSFTGLPLDLIKRFKSRVPPRVFAKELLRDDQKLVGLYDASVSGIDPHPESQVLRGNDPTLEGLTASFTAAFNGYIRDELKWKTDRPYLLLNQNVSRRWRWMSGGKRGQGFVGTASDLKEAMSLNPKLKVMIAHGYFDLVTPFFGTKYTIRQMNLDRRIRENIALKVYRGGHMMYTKTAARRKLYGDAKTFFQGALR